MQCNIYINGMYITEDIIVRIMTYKYCGSTRRGGITELLHNTHNRISHKCLPVLVIHGVMDHLAYFSYMIQFIFNQITLVECE